MIKIIGIFTILFILLFSMNVVAVEGYVSLEYDLEYGTGMAEINASHEIYDGLTIGLQFITYLRQIGLKQGWMPAGEPESQFYRGYLKYKLTDNIILTLSNQCRHFYSLSNIEYWNDTGTIVIGGKYKF